MNSEPLLSTKSPKLLAPLGLVSPSAGGAGPKSIDYDSDSDSVQDQIANVFSGMRPEIKRVIERFLDRRLKRRVDASDVAQSVFFDIQDRLSRYLRERPMEVDRWILFLTKMKTLETNQHHLRYKKRAVTREGNPSGLGHVHGRATSPSQALDRKETRQRLRSALERLPSQYREVIELRSLKGLANKEASQMLEISENAASKLYVRALNALSRILTKESVGEL